MGGDDRYNLSLLVQVIPGIRPTGAIYCDTSPRLELFDRSQHTRSKGTIKPIRVDLMTIEKTLSNMLEVKSRGAYLMGLTTYGNYNIEDTADFSVYVPKTEEYFTTSLAIVPLQLMGYYVSVAKGLDVDKPRNLAKSVTVE